jgi:hypothetical protein
MRAGGFAGPGRVAASAVLVSLLAACSSSFYSPGPSVSNQAAVPPPPAGASVAPAPAYAAAPPPNQDASIDPYPQQSLSELFKGSFDSPESAPSARPAQTAQQNVPRPPSTYTASASPYVPNQQAYGAPPGAVQTAGAVPPQPPPAAPGVTGYATDSLFDLFGSK